jgi:predicted AAA+ superfamily ATPase
VLHSDARGVPLGAQVRSKRFKMLLLDTGLTMRLSGMTTAEIVTTPFEELANRGSLAEQFVGVELVKASPVEAPPELYYWHREAATANAEVDYVISHGRIVVPIEVKSGSRGRMQSMRIFMQERSLRKGIRIAGEPAGRYEDIVVLPLYAASRALDERYVADAS